MLLFFSVGGLFDFEERGRRGCRYYGCKRAHWRLVCLVFFNFRWARFHFSSLSKTGIYFGKPRGFGKNENGEEIGFNTEVYADYEVLCLYMAFRISVALNDIMCVCFFCRLIGSHELRSRLLGKEVENFARSTRPTSWRYLFDTRFYRP